MSINLIGKNTVATGSELYDLLTQGYKNGYNRRLGNLNDYEDVLKNAYESFMSIIPRSARRKIQARNKDWKTVNFPYQILMIHTHKNGIECEPHLRILFDMQVFDIPLTEEIQSI
jgi:hypothetical protein